MPRKLVHLNERKLFNGPKDEFTALHHLKYEWLWKAYMTMSANHWMPSEIPLGLDVEQWNYPERFGIMEQDKLMIKYALGFFAVADSVVADNVLLKFYTQASAPELKMFLMRQLYEEAIHTHSYQYMIEALEINSDEIFEMHLNVQEIYQKMVFPKEQNQYLQWQLLSYYGIVEGIFFYAMFAILKYMESQNKFPGIAKQFQYIMRDETIHFRVGIELFKQYCKEISFDISENGKDIINIFDNAVNCEYAFISKCIKDANFGVDLCTYVDYVKQSRLKLLGIDYVMPVVNPFLWMEELIDIPTQTNFFESQPIDYQVGGLKWD